VQSVVIPVSPEAKTGTQTSLFCGAFWVPDICRASSGMTTQRGGFLRRIRCTRPNLCNQTGPSSP
jgi:hypothetical protein